MMIPIAHAPVRLHHRWQRELGPFLLRSTIADVFGLSPDQIFDLAERGKLLSVPDDNWGPLFPMSALDTAGNAVRLIEGLQLVLEALALGEDDHWLWALWLSGGLRKHEGWCAAEALGSGDRDLVLERARNEDWAWTEES